MIYLTGISKLSGSEVEGGGIFVTCGQPTFIHKFYTKNYIDFEFDDLVAVADVDHSNFIWDVEIPIDPDFDVKLHDKKGLYYSYFFRFFLK